MINAINEYLTVSKPSQSDFRKVQNATLSVHDFSVAENDMLDFSDVLTAYDPLNDTLSDFLTLTNNRTHTYAKVDQYGGADGFDQIAKLVNTVLDMSDFTKGVNLVG